MSPRPRQNSMARSATDERGSRKSTSQHIPRSLPGSASMSSASYTGEMLDYSLRSRSDTLHSDDSMTWNGTFSGHFPGDDDARFDPMPSHNLAVSDSSYMMPVMSGPPCFNSPSYDQFSQGPMSQTLTGPLLESSYQDIMMGDDVLNTSPISIEFPGYGQSSQHTWRHGQLSPPAEIFNPELSDYAMDPTCDMSFHTLPDSAISGVLAYDKIPARSVYDRWNFGSSADELYSASRYGQPRPLRSASEKNALAQTTLAPQDVHYARNDRADKVKARNDPRYDAGPDKDGYYHCPMISEGSCNHKATKQKCIYAKYLDSHLKPYACTHGEKGSECDGARFSSNACLFRHEREAHGMHNHGLNPYLCQYQGCERSRDGNGFPRRWNQRDHMKRVHDWEEPENSGYDHLDRNGPTDSNKRRKSGHSHAVQMKRSSSSHAKAQAASYVHASRHTMSMSRYAAQAEKEMQATMTGYTIHYDDVQYPQVSPYRQLPRTSEAYPYLVAY